MRLGLQTTTKKSVCVCVCACTMRNKHVKAFCDIFYLVHKQQMPKKSENANNMHKLPQQEREREREQLRVLARQQLLRPSPCPTALQCKMCWNIKTKRERREAVRETERERVGIGETKLWPNADELHSFYGKVFWTLLWKA